MSKYNVLSLSGYLLSKVGPEHLTLFQLQQVESEGLWVDDTGPQGYLCEGPAHVIDFREAKAKVYLKKHFESMLHYHLELETDTIWTQLVRSYL
tara:strand:+ start:236 stop:517 length:282 start_codon:yes stop_codon:yes gene_type:complete